MKYKRNLCIAITCGVFALLWLCSLGANAMTIDNWKNKSLLARASHYANELSGQSRQWQHMFMSPTVDSILSSHSVWFDAYPDAIIHAKTQSVLSFLAETPLWQAFDAIGIRAIHTGPMRVSGGLNGDAISDSVDGGFDPIDYEIDSRYGGSEHYQQLCLKANAYNSMIIDDLVPGHTGKGYDFYLALRNIAPYTGLYNLIELDKADWPLLPEVSSEWESKALPLPLVKRFRQKGVLPGELQRVMFQDDKKSLTGWDVTGEIKGADGIKRRWAYLHYFKAGQPSLNWLDPSFSAHRLMAAMMVHSFHHLGAGMMRIDANPFLGASPVDNEATMQSEGTSLAISNSQLLAQMIRKLGGHSFQELNVSLPVMKAFMNAGADFSYDFISRPGLQHAVMTGDTRLLETMLNEMINHGIKTSQLIHGMQNHDEVSYELVHFADNPDKTFQFGGENVKGHVIRQAVLAALNDRIKRFDYLHQSDNGLCTTLAAVVATRLGITDIYAIEEKQREMITKGMLLMAAFNALQGGVFNISAWDLVGSLPLKEDALTDKLADGDCRWFNRGAYSLLSTHPGNAFLPKAKSLFGPLDSQLKDTHSFVSKLKGLLLLRKEYGLAHAELVAAKRLDEGLLLIQLATNEKDILLFLNFALKSTMVKPETLVASMNFKGVINSALKKTKPFTIAELDYNMKVFSTNNSSVKTR